MKEKTIDLHSDVRSALYPPIEPFARHMLDVSGGHRVYVEQSGNPEGQPVVVIHGGPGGGSMPAMRRFFDPKAYHIILFDQRGCGRSTPHACVTDNTTWDLVEDMERIRAHLGIERWILFGGSWGACLSLIYAQCYPARTETLVLRGVFTMTRAELDWFYGGGAGQFWPEEWRRFAQMVPVEERNDLITAYHARLFGSDEDEKVRYAKAWAAWEGQLASLDPGPRRGSPGATYALAFSRIENHYFINDGFLRSDSHIMDNMDAIAEIPGHIVQGRYDMICPPYTAFAIHENWRASQMHLVQTAGHALSEPGITSRLLTIMDVLRQT